jgi:hypothetical protein
MCINAESKKVREFISNYNVDYGGRKMRLELLMKIQAILINQVRHALSTMRSQLITKTDKLLQAHAVTSSMSFNMPNSKQLQRLPLPLPFFFEAFTFACRCCRMCSFLFAAFLNCPSFFKSSFTVAFTLFTASAFSHPRPPCLNLHHPTIHLDSVNEITKRIYFSPARIMSDNSISADSEKNRARREGPRNAAQQTRQTPSQTIFVHED